MKASEIWPPSEYKSHSSNKSLSLSQLIEQSVFHLICIVIVPGDMIKLICLSLHWQTSQMCVKHTISTRPFYLFHSLPSWDVWARPVVADPPTFPQLSTEWERLYSIKSKSIKPHGIISPNPTSNFMLCRFLMVAFIYDADSFKHQHGRTENFSVA